jgi:hypothetical protein
MLASVRTAISKRVEWIAEFAGLAISLSGATVAAVFGRLFIAVFLGGIALGFFLRLSGRRGPTPRHIDPPSLAFRFGVGALSFVETAALVEATNLPVRYGQPEFAQSNWLLVIAVFAATYLLQIRLFASLRRATRTTSN